MKIRKRISLMLGVLSIVSILAYIILQGKFINLKVSYAFYEGIKTISIGIFTSSMITFIVYLSEYFIIKKEVLEEYFIKSNEFLQNFLNLKYVFLEYPKELIMECFEERIQNKIIVGRNSSTYFDELKQLQKNRWEYIAEENEISKKDLEKAIDDDTNRIIDEYTNNIEEAMKQYIDLSKLNYLPLENIYGKMDFFIGNTTLRKEIYNGIHKKQKDLLNDIRKATFHFNSYFQSENGNLAIMLEIILKLQEKIFMEKKEGTIKIYNVYYYDVYCNLMNLLNKINRNKNATVPDVKEFCFMAFFTENKEI